MPGRVSRLARHTTTWLRDKRDIRAARSPSDTAYPEINSLVVRVVRETGARAEHVWGSLHGAYLARTLGIAAVSLIEFGVAGGDGLIALDTIGQTIESYLGIAAMAYGFDTARGLPAPVDWRDCPNLFAPGDYPMDVERLRARLQRAELVIGDVAETAQPFIESRPAPVAFVSFDLDLHSSTVSALRLLEGDVDVLLPRVHCYFDDITGFTYADFNGERLAIHEFNERNGLRKISPFYGLSHYVPSRCAGDLWVEKMHLAHILDHPRYGEPDGLTRVARKDLD